MDNLTREQLNKIIDDRITLYYQKQGFTDRKVTDTPNDALSVVPRKFVTLNGATASRPLSSITGQRYFDTTVGYPVFWSGTHWVKSDGTAA